MAWPSVSGGRWCAGCFETKDPACAVVFIQRWLIPCFPLARWTWIGWANKICGFAFKLLDVLKFLSHSFMSCWCVCCDNPSWRKKLCHCLKHPTMRKGGTLKQKITNSDVYLQFWLWVKAPLPRWTPSLNIFNNVFIWWLSKTVAICGRFWATSPSHRKC